TPKSLSQRLRNDGPAAASSAARRARTHYRSYLTHSPHPALSLPVSPDRLEKSRRFSNLACMCRFIPAEFARHQRGSAGDGGNARMAERAKAGAAEDNVVEMQRHFVAHGMHHLYAKEICFRCKAA